jgi:hypothetical protein
MVCMRSSSSEILSRFARTLTVTIWCEIRRRLSFASRSDRIGIGKALIEEARNSGSRGWDARKIGAAGGGGEPQGEADEVVVGAADDCPIWSPYLNVNLAIRT